MTAAGLFAGIGGIELGFMNAGIQTELLCELDPTASSVLRRHHPEVELVADVCELRTLPAVHVVAAGFPCQDLSQAGPKGGIGGPRSGLVDQVFRLMAAPHMRDSWLALENVSYMLRLDRGRAMDHLTCSLESLGFTWAYRTVDARAFGLPQRRKRVFVVASRTQDPRTILFADNAQPPGDLDSIGAADKAAYGFYWTEGLRGLGWAAEATPTVKGGSALGIPSPPAVWLPRSGFFGTPSINDLERLQGFVSDWTAVPGESEKGRRHRYRLVGNAVAVPVATWLGSRLREPRQPIAVESRMGSGDRWPGAAWGHAGVRYRVEASEWPARQSYQLSSFIQDDLQPLSVRAASGFLSRARRGKLRFADGFLQSLAEFIDGRSDEVPRVA